MDKEILHCTPCINWSLKFRSQHYGILVRRYWYGFNNTYTYNLLSNSLSLIKSIKLEILDLLLLCNMKFGPKNKEFVHDIFITRNALNHLSWCLNTLQLLYYVAKCWIRYDNNGIEISIHQFSYKLCNRQIIAHASIINWFRIEMIRSSLIR